MCHHFLIFYHYRNYRFPRGDDAAGGGHLPVSCNHLNLSQHSHSEPFLFKFSHTEQKNKHQHAFAI